MDEHIERGATIKIQCVDCGNYGFCDNDCSAVESIKRVPAADVRPVVKAKWVYTDMSRLVCSNCGNPAAFTLKDDGWHYGDYCPNCGADMREPPKEE